MKVKDVKTRMNTTVPALLIRIIALVSAFMFTVSLANLSAAETICSDNGGAGWALADAGAGDSPVTTTIIDSFQFADINVPILDINVYLDINHTWVGDLDATITSPSATSVQLFDRPQVPPVYGCGGNNLTVTFDDEAATATNIDALCGGGTPTISGTYQPQNIGTNPLSDFDGESPEGNWTIAITDNATADTGTLNEICLTVTNAIDFDKWVSTNAACSDQVDYLNVAAGTTVYYCYTVTNNSASPITIDSATDDQGIDISALEHAYGAGTSDTVIQSAVAGASIPIGITVNNATVTSGSATLNETATVTVASTPPANGNKPLYLYNNLDLSRTVPTAAQAIVWTNSGNPDPTATWTLNPSLQSNLQIDNSGGSVPVNLWLGANANANRSFTLTLAGSISGAIGSLAVNNFALTTTPTPYPAFNIPISGATNLVSGEAITLTFINRTNGNGRWIGVTPSDGGTNHSYVNLPSNSVINVDGISFYDAAYSGGSPINETIPGSQIYVRAVVSDPFGSYDTNAANITITNPGGTPVVSGAAMTEVNDSGAATKTYEYNYTLPGFGADGTWTASVTANEGSEGTVTHTGTAILIVGTAALTVVKSASGATANPGDVITYTIQVTNTGTGSALNVEVTDDMSPFTNFALGSITFTDGGTPSGLSLGTPVYSNDNGATWTYVPVSGGGGASPGFDANVTDWQIIMNNIMNFGTPDPSFSIQYQAEVK
jgi:uncharacterized repeat protein (TIGR01451 family)